MSIIKAVKAREVLDSRGNPTVEADVKTDDGIFRAIVPSGASAGSHEALELRDGGKRYNGKGVLKAVDNVNKISKRLIGKNCKEQEYIDLVMINLDKTLNKKKLGANAILAVSMACCRAAAAADNIPLYEHIGRLIENNDFIMPMPQLNVINGGKHAGQENDIQEHMIVPVKAKSFSEALRMSAEVYHELKGLLKKKFGATGILVGDEGGFAPKIDNIEERLDTINKAIKNAGYKDKIGLAVDAASSEFFYNGVYRIGKKEFSSGQMIDFYDELVKKYPIVSLEDGMAEDDWEGWIDLTKKIGNKVQIVGDDLLVTNPERIKKAIDANAANSALIKLNQIGTVTETLEAIKIAKENKWTTVVSHRSGETEDNFIADLVVGAGCGQCKFGAPARSDRNAKYNQLLRIEEELGKVKFGK